MSTIAQQKWRRKRGNFKKCKTKKFYILSSKKDKYIKKINMISEFRKEQCGRKFAVEVTLTQPTKMTFFFINVILTDNLKQLDQRT